MLYQFGDFKLNTETYTLRRDGIAVHIEPLVFDLLLFLSQNSGRVVSRDEIIDQVWKGRIVSDATVASCIKSARKALGDSGNTQRYIRTVRGRGIQFVSAVAMSEVDVEPPQAPLPTKATNRPSLAILPFQVFDTDDDLKPLADGLVENLTTILTRVPLLSLASRASAFALRSEIMSAQDIGRRLGVGYMLEGSLQKVRDKLRANVQMIETRSGFHLWAQQFDQPHDADAQQSLLRAILPRLEMHLLRAIHHDLRAKSGELSSGQLLLQATSLLALKGWHETTFKQAAELLRNSIELEPACALAHAHLSLILGLGHRVGLLERSSQVVQEAISEAELALDLDDMDSNVVGLAACALADVGQAERAIPLLKKALDLNPNNGQAWTALGSAYAVLGRAPDAVEPLRRGIEISPMDSRLAVWRAVLALVYLQTGDAEQALVSAEEGCQGDDKAYLPRVVLTAIRLARHDAAEAVTALQDCLRVKPDLSEREVNCLIGPKLGAAFSKLRARR